MSSLARFRTAQTAGRRLTLGYLVFKMPNRAAACNMLGVENKIHLWPRPHRLLECVPVDEVKIFVGQL